MAKGADVNKAGSKDEGTKERRWHMAWGSISIHPKAARINGDAVLHAWTSKREWLWHACPRWCAMEDKAWEKSWTCQSDLNDMERMPWLVVYDTLSAVRSYVVWHWMNDIDHQHRRCVDFDTLISFKDKPPLYKVEGQGMKEDMEVRWNVIGNVSFDVVAAVAAVTEQWRAPWQKQWLANISNVNRKMSFKGTYNALLRCPLKGTTTPHRLVLLSVDWSDEVGGKSWGRSAMRWP